MGDLTAVHVKKRMTSRYEFTFQEKIEFRLTDIYINSKAKRQTIIEDFLKKN